MENLIFQKVEFKNLERFIEIFQLCFNIKVNETYFEWKYKSNPDGEVIAFEAFDTVRNKVVAFYGVMPEKYTIAGVEKTIYQSMDTMTHPDYRNKGLFIKLANLTYDYLKEKNGKSYLIGIPGSNSYYGFVKKLLWSNPINISYTFTITPIIKLLNLFNQKSDYIVKEVSQFNSNVDALLSEKEFVISKKLNSKILNWKFANHPLEKFMCFEVSKNEVLESIAVVEVKGKNLRLILNKGINTEDSQYVLLNYLSNKYPLHFIYTWNTNVLKSISRKYFLTNPFSKGLFSYKVPFITIALNDNDVESLWNNGINFDLYPGIQD